MIHLATLYNIYQQHPKVITDSRKIELGCLFFALKGPHFNGNTYAQEAIEKGAAYAVIDEGEYQFDDRFLLVTDSLGTLQELARYHRQQFDMPLLAITGSNGKTTTKELLNVILNSHYKTHYTVGNLNNHIGVPLTLLSMPIDTEVAIIEMGANHVGEIEFLCQLAEPTHGLITNIGKAHLEGFGSLEGVKKGKSELYKYLAQTRGMIFVNADEDYLSKLASENRYKLFYREDPNLTTKGIYEVQLLSTHPFVKAAFLNTKGKKIIVECNLMGIYNFNNIMTAISVGRYFKVPSQKIKMAIEAYQPTNNRSQLVKVGNNTFLLDAYNANPDSMRKALIHFAKMPSNRKVVILGDMLELGMYSDDEHQEIVDLALKQPLAGIWLIGEAFSKTKQTADKIIRFQNVNLLKSWLTNHPQSETLFLLKGSRGVKLETLLKETALH